MCFQHQPDWNPLNPCKAQGWAIGKFERSSCTWYLENSAASDARSVQQAVKIQKKALQAPAPPARCNAWDWLAEAWSWHAAWSERWVEGQAAAFSGSLHHQMCCKRTRPLEEVPMFTTSLGLPSRVLDYSPLAVVKLTQSSTLWNWTHVPKSIPKIIGEQSAENVTICFGCMYSAYTCHTCKQSLQLYLILPPNRAMLRLLLNVSFFEFRTRMC